MRGAYAYTVEDKIAFLFPTARSRMCDLVWSDKVAEQLLLRAMAEHDVFALAIHLWGKLNNHTILVEARASSPQVKSIHPSPYSWPPQFGSTLAFDYACPCSAAKKADIRGLVQPAVYEYMVIRDDPVQSSKHAVFSQDVRYSALRRALRFVRQHLISKSGFRT